MPMAHRVNPIMHNWLSIASRTTAEEPAVHDRADDDIYEWPICVTPRCGRRLWVSETGRQACRPCEMQAAGHLTELPGLFARLNTPAALMRGSRSGGGATSGSKAPPIPPRLEVLALTGPGGVAARLQAIEDAWRKALGWTVAPWRGSPAQAVPEHTRFLINNLPWATDAYVSVGQDVHDLRRLHAECTAALSGDRRPGRVQIGLCPSTVEDVLCAAQLAASAADHRVRCEQCGARWEGLAEWRALRVAQETVLRADALPGTGVAA